MASITLAQAANLAVNPLARGMIQTIVTVDGLFELLPFQPGTLTRTVAKESVMGDTQVLGVNAQITAKNPMQAVQASWTLTTIVGDAEVNGLVEATMSNVNDQRTMQVQSKVKSAARRFKDMFVNGTGAANQFTGLLGQLAAGQTVQNGTDGGPITFALLDTLISKVQAKDGQVDFITMPMRTVNSILELYRQLGGASINEVMTLASGRKVHTYRGIPLLANDWIPTNQTVGASTTCTTVLAGCWDDGSQHVGVAGLTSPGESAGLRVKSIGDKEEEDATIDRVVWYCGLASFNDLGLAGLTGVTN